jgi:pimeloyl-ACP methyl ester carboxylesterase
MHPTSIATSPARAARSTSPSGAPGTPRHRVAWHGLARTGRDMDDIAAHLAQRWRVICPDTLGRGLSQWSPLPAAEYCLAFYEKLAVSLLDQLGVEQCHWLGTSMGGAIGLRAAAGALRGRIQRLVLNDIGPSWRRRPSSASAATPAARRPSPRAASWSLLPHRLQALRLAERRAVAAPDRDLGAPPARRPRHAALRPGDGAAVHRCHPDDYEQWDAWDSLDLPVLCLRGEAQRPAAARRWPKPCAARPARGGGHHPRLRPCAGAEHARAVRAGRTLPGPGSAAPLRPPPPSPSACWPLPRRRPPARWARAFPPTSR